MFNLWLEAKTLQRASGCRLRFSHLKNVFQELILECTNAAPLGEFICANETINLNKRFRRERCNVLKPWDKSSFFDHYYRRKKTSLYSRLMMMRSDKRSQS
jgi:hypothetical protein